MSNYNINCKHHFSKAFGSFNKHCGNCSAVFTDMHLDLPLLLDNG